MLKYNCKEQIQSQKTQLQKLRSKKEINQTTIHNNTFYRGSKNYNTIHNT